MQVSNRDGRPQPRKRTTSVGGLLRTYHVNSLTLQPTHQAKHQIKQASELRTIPTNKSTHQPPTANHPIDRRTWPCGAPFPVPASSRRGAAAETLCDGNAHLLQPPRTPFDATRHRSCGTYVVFRITFLVGDEIGATAVLRWSNSHGTLPIIASCSMELELHRQFVMSPEKKCAHEMNWRVVATERTANAILPNTSTADVLVVGCCADPEVAAGLTASANCKRVTTS